MKRSDLGELITLAALWGASFLFMRMGAAEFGPVALSAVRAVGAAVGRNPLSVIVPCHRVLGQDGSLTGYAGGLPRKQALLALEGAWPLQGVTALGKAVGQAAGQQA